MSRRAVQTTITLDLIGKLLNLPEGQRVTAIIPASGADILHGTVRLIIESDSFDKVPEGVEPVHYDLTFGVVL